MSHANAVHPTFANVLQGFRPTIPANLPRTVRADARRDNAYDRLLETSRVILASMSLVDQAGLHARLRSDIAAVDACNGGGV